MHNYHHCKYHLDRSPHRYFHSDCMDSNNLNNLMLFLNMSSTCCHMTDMSRCSSMSSEDRMYGMLRCIKIQEDLSPRIKCRMMNLCMCYRILNMINIADWTNMCHLDNSSHTLQLKECNFHCMNCSRSQYRKHSWSIRLCKADKLLYWGCRKSQHCSQQYKLHWWEWIRWNMIGSHKQVRCCRFDKSGSIESNFLEN